MRAQDKLQTREKPNSRQKEIEEIGKRETGVTVRQLKRHKGAQDKKEVNNLNHSTSEIYAICFKSQF